MARFGETAENLFNSDKTAKNFDRKLFCLTNTEMMHGASMILRKDVMKRIGDFMGGNYYVLPSSVHETLIYPDDGSAVLPELSALVHEVNMTLDPQEVLSDKVQYYDRATGVLENAESRAKRLALQ